MKKAKRKTVYQRIVRAGESGRGLRLSAADTLALSLDDAIWSLARNDDFRDLGDDLDLDGPTLRVDDGPAFQTHGRVVRR
jgi:hypothetical protein